MSPTRVQRSNDPMTGPMTGATAPAGAPVQRSAVQRRGGDFAAQEAALQPVVQMERPAAARPTTPAAETPTPATTPATTTPPAADAGQQAATPEAGAGGGATPTEGAAGAATPPARDAAPRRIDINAILHPPMSVLMAGMGGPGGAGPRAENAADRLGLGTGRRPEAADRPPTAAQVASADRPTRPATAGDLGSAIYAIPEVRARVTQLLADARSGTPGQVAGRVTIAVGVAAPAVAWLVSSGNLNGTPGIPLGPVTARATWGDNPQGTGLSIELDLTRFIPALR